MIVWVSMCMRARVCLDVCICVLRDLGMPMDVHTHCMVGLNILITFRVDLKDVVSKDTCTLSDCK